MVPKFQMRKFGHGWCRPCLKDNYGQHKLSSSWFPFQSLLGPTFCLSFASVCSRRVLFLFDVSEIVFFLQSVFTSS